MTAPTLNSYLVWLQNPTYPSRSYNVQAPDLTTAQALANARCVGTTWAVASVTLLGAAQ
jgi:hypothetical protein